ncbi:hypothetical protein JTE90_017271 [Oedothorax gibbosus]|uniref:Uncharacterized protein n=1 Tax=Oedothorax gibbosus TaxID=931172 RepID=A0AAV6VFP1_9ARAC|nr:hypothetical protein JTE90_017271 [Oedothorax gibbosus]
MNNRQFSHFSPNLASLPEPKKLLRYAERRRGQSEARKTGSGVDGGVTLWATPIAHSLQTDDPKRMKKRRSHYEPYQGVRFTLNCE